MNILQYFDFIGTFVFAISGVLTASSKKMDVFGGFIIAFVTAIGGGTLRDVLLGNFPVVWIQDITYLYIVITAFAISLLFKKYIVRLRKTLFLFDTIGIGVFTILGLQTALELGVSAPIAVAMGTISAVFGGVLRDILCSTTPLIFRKEIYATPCILGGITYLLLHYLNGKMDFIILITALMIISFRLLAVKNGWALPRLK
ncbi:MAG: trimeric intracellular cation channel family protein [Owenweeksia sp.]